MIMLQLRYKSLGDKQTFFKSYNDYFSTKTHQGGKLILTVSEEYNFAIDSTKYASEISDSTCPHS